MHNLDRYFIHNEAIYDRDNPDVRAWFGPDGGNYLNGHSGILIDMNREEYDVHSLVWDGPGAHKDDSWAPVEEFVKEYEQAIAVLGEDYFQ